MLVDREKIRTRQAQDRLRLQMRQADEQAQRLARPVYGPPVPRPGITAPPSEPYAELFARQRNILGTQEARPDRFAIPHKSFGERLATSPALTEPLLPPSAQRAIRDIPIAGPALERNVVPLTTLPGLAATAVFPGATLYGAAAATAGSIAGQEAERLGAPRDILGTGIGTRSALELGAGMYGGPGGGVRRGATAADEAALAAERTVAESGGVTGMGRRLATEEIGGTRIPGPPDPDEAAPSGVDPFNPGGPIMSASKQVWTRENPGSLTKADADEMTRFVMYGATTGEHGLHADDALISRIAAAYAPVRTALRQQFGPSIRLIRYQSQRGFSGRKVISMADPEFAHNFIAPGEKRGFGFEVDVPVDDIVAVPTSGNGKYREFIVRTDALKDATPRPITEIEPTLRRPDKPETAKVDVARMEEAMRAIGAPEAAIEQAKTATDVYGNPVFRQTRAIPEPPIRATEIGNIPPSEPPVGAVGEPPLPPGESLKKKVGSYLTAVKRRRPEVLAARSDLLKQRTADSARIQKELMAEGVPYGEATARSKAALKGPMDIEGLPEAEILDMTPEEAAWLVQRRLEMSHLDQIKFQDTLAQIAAADASHPPAPWQWRLIASAWGDEMAEAMRLGFDDAAEDAARSAMASPELPIVSAKGKPILRGAEQPAYTPATTGERLNLQPPEESGMFGPQSELFGVPDSTTFRPVPVNKPPSLQKANEGLVERARKAAERKAKEAAALKEKQAKQFQRQWEAGERKTTREAEQATARRAKEKETLAERQRKSFQREWEKARKQAEREYEAGLKAAGNLPPKGHGVGKFVEAAIKIPATLLTTLDMSSHLIQLWKMTPFNPGAAWDAFKTDVAIWRNPANAGKKLTEMMSDETPVVVRTADGDFTKGWGQVADQAGIYLDESHELEDFYLTTALERIPGIGRAFKRSRLGFTMSGNVARHDVGRKLVQRMMKYNKSKTGTAFVTPDELKQITEFTMRLTGRGDPRFLGQYLSTTLRHLAFAPGLRLSGPQMAMRLASPNPVVRRAAAENLVGWFGLNTAILGAAYYAGQKVNVDPLSPDFGSIVIGNTGYNLWGTDAVLARAIARSIMQRGHSRSVTLPDGTVQKIEWDTDIMNELTRYVRSGATPIVGDVINLMEGENVVGDKINLHTKEGLTNFLEGHLPLGGQSSSDVWKNEQYLQATLSIPFSFAGGKMSSYDVNTPERVIGAMPKYQDVPVDQQWEIRDFLREVEPLYQKAEARDENVVKADFVEFVGARTGREELGKLAAADLRNELPLNKERVRYAVEHASELEGPDLGWSIPLDLARALYDSGEWDEAMFDRYLAGRAE